jgi:L-gulonate 5-dehydrogenase
VVVLGAGPIGLFATLGAVDAGADVLVADREPSRLVHARRLGAIQTVDTTAEDLAAASASFTGGDGPAVIVEATGAPQLLRSAVDLVAHSGTVVVVGLSGDDVALPMIEFTRKELNVLGSRNSTGLFPAATALVRRHAEALAPVVTRVFRLDEAPAAFAYAHDHPGEVEKVVVRVSE